MADDPDQITPENLRPGSGARELLLDFAVDRAVRYGLKARLSRQVLGALPPDEFLEVYYCKTREAFLSRFAPLYYRAAGESYLGPLFDGTAER